jgi:hypothetical protein
MGAIPLNRASTQPSDKDEIDDRWIRQIGSFTFLARKARDQVIAWW